MKRRYSAILVARVRVPVPGSYDADGQHPVEPSQIAEQSLVEKVAAAAGKAGEVIDVHVELVEELQVDA